MFNFFLCSISFDKACMWWAPGVDVFEEGRSRHSQVIGRKRNSYRRTGPTDRQTNWHVQSNMPPSKKMIFVVFFVGWSSRLAVSQKSFFIALFEYRWCKLNLYNLNVKTDNFHKINTVLIYREIIMVHETIGILPVAQ